MGSGWFRDAGKDTGNAYGQSPSRSVWTQRASKAKMKIQDFLAPPDTIIGIKADAKTSLLRDLSRHAARLVDISFDQIATAIIMREALGSTGTGDGVALPHARLQEIRKPFGLLARLKHPIDFDAIDGKPVDLVFFLLLPVRSPGEQLGPLASVARILRRTEVLEGLRRGVTSNDLYRVMTAEARRD
jgi:PTS system nitrogen regulatory IIA component